MKILLGTPETSLRGRSTRKALNAFTSKPSFISIDNTVLTILQGDDVTISNLKNHLVLEYVAIYIETWSVRDRNGPPSNFKSNFRRNYFLVFATQNCVTERKMESAVTSVHIQLRRNLPTSVYGREIERARSASFYRLSSKARELFRLL